MADVFTIDPLSPVGASAPVLAGGYYPSIDRPMIDGRGLIIPWGGGSLQRQMVSRGGAVAAPATRENQLLSILASITPIGDVINYNFEGLIGPTGPTGPPGPSGLGMPGASIPGSSGASGDALTADIPITQGIVFSDGGDNKVTWTTGNLRYKGTDYTIAVESTGDTNVYIYWDKDTTPTQFLTTDTLATVVGTDKWLMCYNDGGTPYPAFGRKIVHGGVVQADTITASQIAGGTITTAEIAADTITAGNIDGDTITAAEIVAGTITYTELRQTGGSEAVDTGCIRAEATRILETATTSGETGFIGTGSFETVQSDTIASQGNAVLIGASCIYTNYDVSTSCPVWTRVYDGSSEITSTYQNIPPDSTGGASLFILSVPGSGNKTFYLQSKAGNAEHIKAKERSLSLDEGLGK